MDEPIDTGFDSSKSLQELENVDEGDPGREESLVATCRRLRRKPLAEFTAEDLRIMIGQWIGLPYLIPLAIERLQEDPLVGGDLYPGDLLTHVLGIRPDFWETYPHLWNDVEAILFRIELLERSIGRIRAARETFDHALDSLVAAGAGDAGARPAGQQSAGVEPEQAKEIVRSYFDRLLNEHDLSVCAELLAPDYVDHDAPADTPPGPDGTRRYVAGFLQDYPDMQVTVEEIIAEGDTVAVRNVWHGTHRASGEELNQEGIAMLRLNEDGQLAERWSFYASPTEDYAES